MNSQLAGESSIRKEVIGIIVRIHLLSAELTDYSVTENTTSDVFELYIFFTVGSLSLCRHFRSKRLVTVPAITSSTKCLLETMYEYFQQCETTTTCEVWWTHTKSYILMVVSKEATHELCTGQTAFSDMTKEAIHQASLIRMDVKPRVSS